MNMPSKFVRIVLQFQIEIVKMLTLNKNSCVDESNCFVILNMEKYYILVRKDMYVY